MTRGRSLRKFIYFGLITTLMTGFGALAQPSFMSAGVALTKIFGSNACVAQCEMKLRGDSIRDAMTMQFAVMNGNVRWEVDTSQPSAFRLSPPARRQGNMNQQVVIIRPDLKLSYVIFPQAKAYFVQDLEEDSPTKVEMTELGKQTINHHPCTKTKVVINSDLGQHETVVWFATDLNRFPMKIETREGDMVQTLTFSKIQFSKPDPKQFEPPAQFKKYDNLMELTADAQKASNLNNGGTNNVPDERIAALIDYTVRKGTNRPVSIATSKALGLGEKEVPTMQLILAHNDGGPVHCFGFSTRNTNDVLVAVIDRDTRKGIDWLTSLDGKIRKTILTSTNAAPEVVANDSHVREFQEQLEFFSEFMTQAAWEATPHSLSEAAKFGSVSDVAAALKHKKKALNKKDDEGQTPLATAVVQGEVGVVRFLLEQGADPNIPNKNGLTPLDHACSRDKAIAMTLAKLLLDHGANVNTKRPNPTYITSLSWAVSSDNTELVRLLIDHGADITAAYDTGATALHTAAGRGDLEIAKLLIEHGADVNAKLTDGWTPLHEAAYSGHKNIVELLLAHGADINATDIHGATPLAWAQGADVKELLRQRGSK
jgi:hypothetical protein